MSRRRVVLVSALFVAAIATSCDGGGYLYTGRNESDESVIVLYGGTSAAPDVDGYLMPAHAYGSPMWAMGSGASWRGRMRVLDLECKVLWDGEIDGDVGGFLVDPDQAVTWVSEGVKPMPSQGASAIEQTERCIEAVSDS